MRWPFMLKRTHDDAIKFVWEIVDREYNRAMKDGKAQVHAFMREANANVYNHPRPEIAIRAVFQQAESEFGPPPTTMSAALSAPANFEEAINAAARS